MNLLEPNALEIEQEAFQQAFDHLFPPDKKKNLKTQPDMERAEAMAGKYAIEKLSGGKLDETRFMAVQLLLRRGLRAGWERYWTEDEDRGSFVQEYIHGILEKERAANPNRGSVSEWKFILEKIVPQLEKTHSPEEILQMVGPKHSSKLRASIPYIRPIFKEAEGGDLNGKVEELEWHIEQVVDPTVTMAAYRANLASRSGISAPPPVEISSDHAGKHYIGDGRIVLTFEVSELEAYMIEQRLGSMLEGNSLSVKDPFAVIQLAYKIMGKQWDITNMEYLVKKTIEESDKWRD